MKTKIAVGAVMLLTLGSAVAGGFMYQTAKPADAVDYGSTAVSASSGEVTPELIAKWKATAASADYSSPMLPI